MNIFLLFTNLGSKPPLMLNGNEISYSDYPGLKIIIPRANPDLNRIVFYFHLLSSVDIWRISVNTDACFVIYIFFYELLPEP